MKVATSLYDASQGSKGGGALGLVIKSGSKDFHWEVYWSHRNDALNANEWFRNANGVSKRARLLQNVFGGSGSGPVPKVGGFWFFNYQGVRARNGIDPLGSSSDSDHSELPHKSLTVPLRRPCSRRVWSYSGADRSGCDQHSQPAQHDLWR